MIIVLGYDVYIHLATCFPPVKNTVYRNTKILDVKTCRIFAINIRKRGIIHGKNGKTVAGVRLDNNTASTKQSER
jgi:hypothetical protein